VVCREQYHAGHRSINTARQLLTMGNVLKGRFRSTAW
jgi:hypothetical protein